MKRLLPIILLTFVNTIGFSILIPVLPFITDQYEVGALTYGALISLYSIFQFLAAPLIGSLSDKYGRRPTLILSQAGTLTSWFIFGLAYFLPNTQIGITTLPIIIISISRIVDGITGGNISVTNAYIADISTPKERTKLYGTMGAVMGFGLIVGPVIGGYTASFSLGYLGTVISAAIISLVTLLFIVFFLSESLKEEDRCPNLQINFFKEINIFKKIKQFSSNLKIKKLFYIRFFFAFAFTSFTSTFVLYAKDFLNLAEREVGLLMLVIGTFSIFNHTVVINFFTKRLSDKTIFKSGQLILALSFFLIIFKPNLIWFTALMFLANMGIAFSMTTFKSMLTNSVDSRSQGRVTGIDESILAGMNGISPVLAGTLYGIIFEKAFGVFAIFLLIPFLFHPKNGVEKIQT